MYTFMKLEESEEKVDLQTVSETKRNNLSKERNALERERNNVKRNRDIFEFDTEECDIEFDTMENKRMNEFCKFNKSILKMKRILELSFIFFNLYLMVYIFKDNIYDYLDTRVNNHKYDSISYI